jgi:hypothetical protein
MPNGWPLQRMRSMRKEEAETRSKGAGSRCEKRKKERKRTLLLMIVARTEAAS